MNVERRESSIHGWGVFARQPIKKDDWQYVYGEIRPLTLGWLDTYCFRYEEESYMPYAPWCWLNHSATPNCEIVDDDGVLIIVALRRIPTNHELTIDYGYNI